MEERLEGSAVGGILAFDVGTTHLKWIIVDGDTVTGNGETAIAATGADPVSEQDPVAVADRVQAMAAAVQRTTGIGRVSFSAAMHSLLAVDAEGRPLTRSWTWMDRRAMGEAAALRRSDAGERLRHETGAPVHAMSPLVKWLQMRASLPAEARPVALKDYLVFRLTGRWLTDFSTAAASGFLAKDNAWSATALELGALTPERLPQLHDMACSVPERRGRFDVVIGASDAAAQHVHLRLERDGAAGALSMGTSGAVRHTAGAAPDHAALFCYTMGPERGYLAGAALSNVGNLLAWLGAVFGIGVDAVVAQGLSALEGGRELPLVVPYWYGERTPWWREDLTGAWMRLGREHAAPDLFGATLLAIGAAYRHGLDLLDAAGAGIQELRGASGLLDHPGLAPWMADVLERDVVVVGERDASLLGALDLARPAGVAPLATASTRHHPRNARMAARAQTVWDAIAAAAARA